MTISRIPKRLLFLLGILALGGGLLNLVLAQEPAKIPGLVQKLKGHDDAIYALEFTPDGKYVITGSFDKTLKMWDVKTGKTVRTFGGPQGHKQMVLCLALSPDGQTMISGGLDKQLKVWNVPSSSPLKTLTNNEAINDIALTSDAKKVATAGKDGLVKIYNAEDGKELFKLAGHTGEVKAVAFSTNNATIGSAGVDGTLRFWNATNGQPITVIGGHTGSANDIVIHPNNVLTFSVGDDGLLRFFNNNTPKPRDFTPQPQPITLVVASADTNQILTASADKNVRIMNYANGQPLRTLKGVADVVQSASFNSNASKIATGLKNGQLVIWNNANGTKEAEVYAHNGPVTSVSIRPQNDQVLTSDDKGLVKIWQLPLVPSKSLAHPDAVLAMALRADGTRVYTGSKDKNLRAWVVANKQMERQYTGHTAPVTAVAITPNSALLASGSEDATIRFWNQSNGQEDARIGAHGKTVSSMAFNGANNQLVSGSQDGTVKLWSVPVTAPKSLAHPDQVTSLVLTPDNQRVITGGNDKNVRLWNLTNGANERNFGGHSLPITAVAVSANGQFIAGSSQDKSFSVWNLSNGQVVKKITVPAPATAVAVNSNGQVAAVGSGNSIQLFEMKEGKEVKKLAGHGGAISGLLYVDDNQILSSSADKTLRLWTVNDGQAKKTLTHVGPITSFTLSKDKKLVAASAGKSVKIWQLADGKEVTGFETKADIKSLAFSPDGNRLVVGETDNTARVYGVDGELSEFFQHTGPVLAVGYHSDNKQIVTAGADKIAKVWKSSLIWQKAHDTPVSQVIFSPANNQVFSASEKDVKIWNVADGKEVKTIIAHGGKVTGLGISADAKTLATTGADKTAKVWNLADGKVLATITLKAVPESVTLSPDGKKVAVGVTEDGKNLVRVFDAKTGQELQTFTDHKGTIPAVAFHTDNKTLVSASADKNVQVSNVSVLTSLKTHAGAVVSAQFDNTGTKFLSAGADKLVKVWDIAKGTEFKKFGPVEEPVTYAAFSRNYAAVGAASGKTVRIWTVADGKETSKLVHPAKVTSLAFNSDNSRIVTGGEDKKARVWDTKENLPLEFFELKGPAVGVVFHANNTDIIAAGEKIASVGKLSIQRLVKASKMPLHALGMYSNGTYVFTGGDEKEVKMWNISNGNNDRTFKGATAAVKAISMSKNNQMLAVGGAGKKLRTFKFADAKELKTIDVPAEIVSLDFSPDSKALAGVLADNTVIGWDTNFPNVAQPMPENFLSTLQEFKHTAPATAAVFANDNSRIFSGSQDKTVKIWRLASADPVKATAHPQYVDCVAFSPDGKFYASGGHDGHVRIYDSEKHTQVRDINAHQTKNETMIYGIAFHPNGQLIASCGYDNTIRVWNVSNGSKTLEIKGYKKKEAEKGHKDSVFSVAFSPDGKTIASGSGGLERVVKLWNASNGQLIRELENTSLKKPAGRKEVQSHPGWVYKLAFSKDGQRLITAGDAPRNKGYVAVWNVGDGKLLVGKEFPLGSFYGLDVSPNGEFVALAAGARGRPAPELNSAYVLKLAELK